MNATISEEAARRVALLDAPGCFDVQRAIAALWMLEQIDGGHLTFSHNAMSAENLEGWCRGICKDAISTSLVAAVAGRVKASTRRAIRMSEAERTTAAAPASATTHQPEKVTDLMAGLKRSLKRHKGVPA